MEWISINDQLPPLSTWVLALSSGKGIYEVRRSGSKIDKGYLRTDWVLPWYMNDYVTITHWMPQPSLPNAKEEPMQELLDQDEV